MKKIIAVIIASLLCLCALCGCGIDEKPASLEDSMEIPENGIISESVFQTLKDENKVITFKGTSGEIEYEWTVFGSDITEPKDTNLKVEVIEDTADNMIFKLCAEDELNFKATLSIHSKVLWKADTAQLFLKDTTSKDGTSKDAIGQVSITGEKASILNVTVSKPDTYVIKPVIKQSETQKETKKDEQKETEEESDLEEESGRAVSDGTQTGQDQYNTDPVPEGEPLPVEPEDQIINEGQTYYCTFSIECSTILNNLGNLEEEKLDCVPSDGMILYPVTAAFSDGESVFDVLQRICNEYGIHMEASWTPIYNSAYVEGIGNLYEFDCGSGSGWMYRVNGWYPNYGCSRYQLADGDYVEWRYTCDLGSDIGGGYAIGG